MKGGHVRFISRLRAAEVGLLLEHPSLLFDHLLVGRVALFQPLRISERVQSVVTRRAARAYASEHDDLDLIAGEERVS